MCEIQPSSWGEGMSRRLKLCPECKSDLIDIKSSRRMGMTQINCTDCGYGISVELPEEEAIKVWNREETEG